MAKYLTGGVPVHNIVDHSRPHLENIHCSLEGIEAEREFQSHILGTEMLPGDLAVAAGEDQDRGAGAPSAGEGLDRLVIATMILTDVDVT